uniref:Uncharacterized protein n=1 Tax=Arundo donax TaxID=35708 RepID=A0A0A8YK31_ARUDO
MGTMTPQLAMLMHYLFYYV